MFHCSQCDYKDYDYEKVVNHIIEHLSIYKKGIIEQPRLVDGRTNFEDMDFLQGRPDLFERVAHVQIVCPFCKSLVIFKKDSQPCQYCNHHIKHIDGSPEVICGECGINWATYKVNDETLCFSCVQNTHSCESCGKRYHGGHLRFCDSCFEDLTNSHPGILECPNCGRLFLSRQYLRDNGNRCRYCEHERRQ